MIDLVDAAKMEEKPKKKKWMKKAVKPKGDEPLVEQAKTSEESSHKGKKHSPVKAMYGAKSGKYFGHKE